jgi:hypothetical protein
MISVINMMTALSQTLTETDEIDVCLHQFRPSVVCVTETGLNYNIPDIAISFSGYNVVRRDVPKKMVDWQFM